MDEEEKKQLVDWAARRMVKGFPEKRIENGLAGQGLTQKEVKEVIAEAKAEAKQAPPGSPPGKKEEKKKPGALSQSTLNTIGFIIVLLVFLMGITGVVFYVMQETGNPPQESYPLSQISEIVSQVEGQKVEEGNASFITGDQVRASEVSEETGVDQIQFCAGIISLPLNCTAHSFEVCPSQFYFTRPPNQEFFSTDSSPGRIKAVDMVSGKIRVTPACDTYFIGFQAAQQTGETSS